MARVALEARASIRFVDERAQVAFDLGIRPLELDGERNPSTTKHATTPMPAPAALTLKELTANFAAALTLAGELSRALSSAELPDAEAALWLSLSAVELERVVQLEELNRRVGSSSSTHFALATSWPLPKSLWDMDPAQAFSRTAVARLLQTSGYRDFQDQLLAKTPSSEPRLESYNTR